jgi:hypothetical protein
MQISRWKCFSLSIALVLCQGSSLFAQELKPTSHAGHAHTLILVDKKTNTLSVAHYEPDDSFKILKTYHATTGKVKGDKE